MVGSDAPLVAGVDSSTTATKVEVREVETGRITASGSAPHPPTQPPRSEQDPATWQSAFQAAWQQAGRPDVNAISIAGQQHGMVVLDEERRVIRPAKLWNDTESASDSAWLIDQLPGGSAAWADACGVVPVPSITITKLSWLRRTEPEAWRRLAHVLLPHDWLTLQLTGRLATDRGDASGTGYWSAATGAYRFDLLAVVDGARDWSELVPPVLGPGDSAGEWHGAVVGPGTGDNMAGALGLGLRPGDVAVSIGTSGTVYTVSDTPTADPSGAVAGFADASGRHLPLVCTLNATKVTDAFARLLGVDHVGLDELVLAAAPGAGGLTLLPYFDGERTPNRPSATGVLSGLRSNVTREQVARAAFEGVVCGLLDGLDALSRFAPVGGRLLLAGGGAHSRAYRQVLADLSGRAVLVPRSDQPVATGACVQAAAVATGESSADIADRWQVAEGDEVEPGAGTSAAAEVRAAYGALRDADP